mgnify:CR=1 FL=1
MRMTSRLRGWLLNDERHVWVTADGAKTWTDVTPKSSEQVIESVSFVADDQARGVDLRGLVILGIGARVADVGIGQGDDLAGVRGVREDLLVARQCGIEDDFAAGTAPGANRQAAEYRAIGQSENCGRKRG